MRKPIVVTLVAVSLLLSLSLWARYQAHVPQKISYDKALPDFSFPAIVGGREQPLSLSALKGKVWIAGFVFTNCMGPCPLLTGRMAKLQLDLPVDIKLVTFTVDPQSDTLPVLKRYGQRFNADFNRWYFVRGEESDLAKLVSEGFALPLSKNSNAPAASRMVHTTKLVLVDDQGRVRNYYDSDSPESFTSILADARKLVKS